MLNCGIVLMDRQNVAQQVGICTLVFLKETYDLTKLSPLEI